MRCTSTSKTQAIRTRRLRLLDWRASGTRPWAHWTREQTASLVKEGIANDAEFATRPSGLVIYTSDDGPRVYVPEKRRKPLFKWFHETAGHVAAAKTHSLITKDYYWPHSRRDVRK